MLTCTEVSRATASDELASSGWRTRMAAKLHLLMCRHCRRYSRQIRSLGHATRQILRQTDEDAISHEQLRSAILDHTPANDQIESDPSVE